MAKYKAILTELLHTALGMQKDEITEILKTDEEEVDDKAVIATLKDKDKTRVSTIKKTAHDEGYKKAEKLVKTDVEKTLKSKFEIDSDKQGEELYDEILEASKAVKKDGGDSKALTEEAVKKHPIFLKMETDFQKQIKAQEKAYKEELEKTGKEYAKKQTFDQVEKQALAIFDELKPILSSDPKKAANQKAVFIQKIKEGFDYELVNGQTIVNKEGKLYEDEHGNKVDFRKHVTDISESLFDFQKADERSAAGGDAKKVEPSANGGNGGNGGAAYTGPLPKSNGDYIKLMNEAKDSGAKKAIQDSWRANPARTAGA